jgi:hypothetical protein
MNMNHYHSCYLPYVCLASAFKWEHLKKSNSVAFKWEHVKNSNSVAFKWEHLKKSNSVAFKWEHLKKSNSVAFKWEHLKKSNSVAFFSEFAFRCDTAKFHARNWPASSTENTVLLPAFRGMSDILLGSYRTWNELLM